MDRKTVTSGQRTLTYHWDKDAKRYVCELSEKLWKGTCKVSKLKQLNDWLQGGDPPASTETVS